VTLPGQGISQDGALSFNLQLDMRGGAARRPRAPARGTPQRGAPSPLAFLQSFELGPQFGLHSQPQKELSRASDHPVMKRRLGRGQATGDTVCSVKLERVGKPLALYTKPPCTISFYTNISRTSSEGLPQAPMCAICLSCPTCGKKKAFMHWDRLKRDLFPLLLNTGFLLLRESFGVSQKSLIGRAARLFAGLPESDWVEVAVSDSEPESDGPDLEVTVFIDRECDISSMFTLRRNTKVKDLKKMIVSTVFTGEATEEAISLQAAGRMLRDTERITSGMTEIDICDASSSPPPPSRPKKRRRPPKAKAKLLNPLKQLADAAFKDGAYWYALSLYSHSLRELPDSSEEAPKALSNRAACLAKLNDFAGSLGDARRAAELAPSWGRAWSRIGLAAWRLGGDNLTEAKSAYMKAVELEPSGANVDALQGIVQLEGPNLDNAHDAQEKGNQALRVKEYGLAVAEYTRGIASLPPLSEKPSSDKTEQVVLAEEDVHALLRAVLYMNRSMAFTWLRYWPSAVADARKAVEAKADFSKARSQLGVALLGNREHEQAYLAFAQALYMDQNGKSAEKGRKACLLELQFWRSRASRTRLHKRWSLDLQKPRGSARVFAISDIHFANRGVQDWAHAIDDFAFLDDTLIVAGNLAESLGAIVRGLTTLKSKFRRVFYTVGNREMWLVEAEMTRYPDSLAKLHAIFEVCDRLEVDIGPAPVCEGVFVIPLLSWYTAEFDEKDPFPTMNADINKKCKWPMDADEQLWKYMLKLNEEHLSLPFRGTVISFSHFLPRRGLPFNKDASKYMAKCVGCEAIDKQVRAVNSKLHVFGHSGEKYASTAAGVRYVHMPLGKLESFAAGTEKDQQDVQSEPPPLMLVHNGQRLCMQEWGIDGSFANRVQFIQALAMPKLVNESEEHKELRKVLRKINDLPGVKVHFHSVGTRKLNKEQLTKAAWPELEKLVYQTTHGLHVVVDDVAKLRDFLHGEVYKEWLKKTERYTDGSVGLFAPLGMDLEPHDPVTQRPKEDSMLAVYFLTLQDTVTEDSQEYGNILSAVVAINRLPGAANRIAAAIQPVGLPPFTAAELLSKVRWQNTSFGCTHLFLVAVDSPESLKLLYQSKTFAKWKSSVEPHLKPGANIPQCAFAIPLGVTATAQAPRTAAAAQDA